MGGLNDFKFGTFIGHFLHGSKMVKDFSCQKICAYGAIFISRIVHNVQHWFQCGLFHSDPRFSRKKKRLCVEGLNLIYLSKNIYFFKCV